MSHRFQLELTSPEKSILNKSVAMVTVPGASGRYGVLVGHAPMITTLQPGVVEVYEQDDATLSDRIFVAGGFAEVTGGRCTLLADEVLPVNKIDRAAVQEEIKTLTSELDKGGETTPREALETRLSIARAKLRAAV